MTRSVEPTGTNERRAHQLLLLALHGALGATEAQGILDRLAEAGAVRIVDEVLVAPEDDRSSWRVDEQQAGSGGLEPAAWAWLVGRTLGNAEDPGSGGAPMGGRHDPGLSASFVAEVRAAAAATRDRWIVAVVTCFDAGAAVAAFRPYPATRLIYGDLPDRMLDRARAGG